MGRKNKTNKKPNGRKWKNMLREKVLHTFKENNQRIYNHKQVSAQLNITDAPTRKVVRSILDELTNEGTLEAKGPGKYKYIKTDVEFMGVIDATKNGAAYVVTDGSEDDIYIAPRNLLQALHGDLVRVAIFTSTKRRRPEGEVLEVMDQNGRQFVGRIEISKKFAFLRPDNPKISVDVFIPLGKLNKANNGDKAIAQITDWPRGATSPFGKIVEVLGKPGETNTEIHAILAEYGLPRSFPKHVEDEAEKIPMELAKDEVAKRRDVRKVTTFTIDPEDAKDFDDAISMQQLKNGNWEVGVHIADVSHYVQPDSIIDKEALNRATSVYLVDRVVPMLPEKLSNEVCSLRPNEDKFTFSAIFELDEKANVIKEWFGRTVIHSDRRFSYEEAQAVIETKKGDFKEEILKADELSKILRKKRMDKGGIEFSSREVKFKLDENGKPLSVYEKTTKDSNKLIEDFMLLANRRVAAFVGKPKDDRHNPKVFVYRVHDKPNMEKLETLKRFLLQFDYKLKIYGDIKMELNKMLKEFEGTNERKMIEMVTIRTMAKAVYTTENIGHYGLGFEYYSHFTSPIRRYPDLLVHRLLQRYLDEKPSATDLPLDKYCKHSSIMEKKAADAERSSIKFMQVLFMEDKVGQTFEGTVTGLTEWGMYVEITENKCEGMVSIRDMGDDFYYFDEASYSIKGRSFDAQFRLADKVNIIVKNTNLEKKQMDFALAEQL